ncbi:unnamed protein product [Anisakis simplex]|uniref:Uncharacterized protein n=1 Tax=Anisakis simplex TaxID=6269 RepID=A0A3P6NTS1_ANISI|nr:unnamed protein product [Anisakis simplex]
MLGQAYEESAQRVFKRPNSRITWDHMKYIQEFETISSVSAFFKIPRIGIQRIYEKRGDRSRPNAWRRYGALMKLHEIGGWQSSRRHRKYYFVEPGSKTGNEPNRPPITIRDSKFIPASGPLILCWVINSFSCVYAGVLPHLIPRNILFR